MLVFDARIACDASADVAVVSIDYGSGQFVPAHRIGKSLCLRPGALGGMDDAGFKIAAHGSRASASMKVEDTTREQTYRDHCVDAVVPLWFREGSCRWPHALSEKGDHLGIERTRRGEAAHGPGEVSDLNRVNHAERQPTPARAAMTVASKSPFASKDETGNG